MNFIQEVQKIFNNSLEEDVLKELKRNAKFNSQLVSYQLKSIVQEILKTSQYDTLLVPSLGIGTLVYGIDSEKSILGYETDGELYKIVANNIYKDKGVQIINEDFLQASICGKFDAIVSITPCGWISDVYGQRIRLEREYINRSLDLLKDNGIMIMIIPNNVLTAPLWQKTRERIINYFSLEMIVSCGRVFDNTHADWSIIVVKNNKQSEIIYFPIFFNNENELVNNYIEKKGEFWVQKKQLCNRWDRNYYDPKHDAIKKEIRSKDTRKLAEVAEVIRGIPISKTDVVEDGKYLILKPSDISNGFIDRNKINIQTCNIKAIISDSQRRAILQDNDIIVSLVGTFKTYIYKAEDGPAIISHNLAIIRTKDYRYVKLFFESKTGVESLRKQAELYNRDTPLPVLSFEDLKNFAIPSLEALEVVNIISENEKDLCINVAKQFEQAGWEVMLSYRVNKNLILDVALLVNKQLKGFVEIKNLNNPDYEATTKQVNFYNSTLNLDSVFCFINKELFQLKDNKLTQLPYIPRPLDDELAKIQALYTDVKDEVGITIEKLSTNDISVALKLFIEILSENRKMLERIDRTTQETHGNVIEVKEMLGSLINDVKRWKNSNRDIEEKLVMIQECIERSLKAKSDDIDRYRAMVEVWLGSNYYRIEEKSDYYLPSAEFLYDELSKFKDADLSPFILQYCRAIENEVLSKIFVAFMKFLKDNNISIEQQYKEDLSDENKQDPYGTYRFTETIRKYINKDEIAWRFELGVMIHVMQLMASEKNSPILNDFRNFLDGVFDSNILDKDFLKLLNKIKDEYRNKAAHPDYISLEKAKNGQEQIREALNTFLDSYKI